jgi:hypothetical protein
VSQSRVNRNLQSPDERRNARIIFAALFSNLYITAYTLYHASYGRLHHAVLVSNLSSWHQRWHPLLVVLASSKATCCLHRREHKAYLIKLAPPHLIMLLFHRGEKSTEITGDTLAHNIALL